MRQQSLGLFKYVDNTCIDLKSYLKKAAANTNQTLGLFNVKPTSRFGLICSNVDNPLALFMIDFVK